MVDFEYVQNFLQQTTLNPYSSSINVKASAGYSGLVDVSTSLTTDIQKKAAQLFNDQ